MLDEILRFELNYTYTQKKHAKIDTANYYEDGRVLNYPNHLANFVISLRPVKQFDTNLQASYQSAPWAYRNATAGANAAPGFYYKGSDIVMIYLFLRYRPIESVQLQLGAYYYQPDRRVLAGVEVKF